jgi:hypothetical protein
MTVRLETKINRYVGLSTDTKPYPGLRWMDATGAEVEEGDVPAGSSFLEADTNEVWRWTGREWVIGDSREVRELKDIKGLLGVLVEQGTPSL